MATDTTDTATTPGTPGTPATTTVTVTATTAAGRDLVRRIMAARKVARLTEEIQQSPAQTLQELAHALGCTPEWVRRMLLDRPILADVRRRALADMRAARRKGRRP